MTGKRLAAMDMDGTITQHKSPLNAENRRALECLLQKYRVVIVGAGTCARIDNQLNLPGADILGSYGMQTALWNAQTNKAELVHNETRPVDKNSVTLRMAELRQRYGFTEYTGQSVEFHPTGMVTLPLLGTTAPLDAKLAFDPDRSRRRDMFAFVKELFSEYTVFIGGTSSFDMVPQPFNKYYALSTYAGQHGYKNTEIIYFGDDYGPGGNDSQIYGTDIDFIQVDRYTDFAEIAQKELL